MINEEDSEANYLYGIRALILLNYTHLPLVLYPLSKYQSTPWLHQEILSQPKENPKQFFHPAFAVTNIKNAIPIILDQSDDRFGSWVELFTIVACANDVLDHISTKTPRSPSIDDTTWNQLDALIKQWIYSTITLELLQAIMLPGATA